MSAAVTDARVEHPAPAAFDTARCDNGTVTDSRVNQRRPDRADTESRDIRCVGCGQRISPDEPVCIFRRYGNEPQTFNPWCRSCAALAQLRCDERQWRYWTKDGGNPPSWLPTPSFENPDYDVFRSWELRECIVCNRPLLSGDKKLRSCSEACHERQTSAVVRERRRQARESEIPDSFTCEHCGETVEETVVFASVAWRDEKVWCDPCFAEAQTEKDRSYIERYGDGPTMLGRPPANPDLEGYDPFNRRDFEPKPCGHCGRSIRWGWPYGFCCERCAYEDEKASRRVERTEVSCEVCGEPFTPKRRDAKTCSDRCRQRKRRERVTAARVKAHSRTRADTAKRDSGGGS